jgi:hypothetical protein
MPAADQWPPSVRAASHCGGAATTATVVSASCINVFDEVPEKWLARRHRPQLAAEHDEVGSGLVHGRNDLVGRRTRAHQRPRRHAEP